MGKQEYAFQDRLIKILRGKGYLVINAASKQLFDLVAVKNQISYPIEVKAKETFYPHEQFRRQLAETSRTSSTFYVVRQSKKRGKMIVACHGTPAAMWNDQCIGLMDDLEEYFEES